MSQKQVKRMRRMMRQLYYNAFARKPFLMPWFVWGYFCKRAYYAVFNMKQSPFKQRPKNRIKRLFGRVSTSKKK